VIVGLARRYGWTIDQVLDMPLDQIAAACYDDDGGGSGAGAVPAPTRKRWAVPIRGPEHLARLWDEHQVRRELDHGG
jgi:hypothetical protein